MTKRRSQAKPRMAKVCQDCGADYIGTEVARFCPACANRKRAAAAVKRGRWTPERDAIVRQEYDPRERGSAKRLAKKLGVSVTAMYCRASALGLTLDRATSKAWAAEEVAFLSDHVGSRTCLWIARKLGRSLGSVHQKAHSLGILRRWTPDEFSAQQVADGFGVSQQTARTWITAGRLKAQKSGDASAQWLVTLDAVRKFVRENPTAFDIRRVDQTWFLDVMIGISGAQSDSRRSA